MSEYDDPNMPPPDAMGDDRPSDNEDQLNDVSPEFDDPEPVPAPADDDDDDESLLSEVDEAQFADFDPSAVQVAPDYDSLKTIKASRRQRAPGEEAPQRSKEGRREKVKKNKRRQADSDDGFSGGEEIDGKRSRKSKSGTNGERKARAPREEIDESTLTPEERRRRALDRAMDAAIKKTSTRRLKRGEIVSIQVQLYGNC
jgi:transcription factor SPN1